MRPVGRMVLNRNPDNFFAETEQVAFCTAHVVPGIDFTNDPLLQGRIFSYLDTQISRLGGPNFHETPDQRAGRAGAQQPARRHAPPGDPARPRQLRAQLARRRLPVPGRHATGFTSFPRADPRTRCAASPRSSPTTTRRRRSSAKSQTPVEQDHIVGAFRFELTRVQTPAVRERMVSMLANVDAELAQRGRRRPRHARCRAAQPRVLENPATPEVEVSPALSLFARPGDGSVGGAPRRDARRATASTASRCARPTRRSPRPARCRASSAPGSAASSRRAATPIDVEVTLETMPVGALRRGGACRRATPRSATLAAARPGARSSEGPVPPLQADPGARRRDDLARRRGHPTYAARRQRRPRASSPRRAAGAGKGSCRRRMPRSCPHWPRIAHFAREMDPPAV